MMTLGWTAWDGMELCRVKEIGAFLNLQWGVFGWMGMDEMGRHFTLLCAWNCIVLYLYVLYRECAHRPGYD